MKAVVSIVLLVFFSLACYSQHSFSDPHRLPARNPYWTKPSSTAFEAASTKRVYTIIYNDSTVVTVRAEIGDYKGKTFLMIDEPGVSKTIQPKDTKSLIAGTQEKPKYVSIATDSTWLFKVIIGKINLYSLLPKTDRRFIVGLQKGNDAPIVPLTKENLLMMIEKGHRARNFIAEGRLVDAVKFYDGIY